MPIPQLSRNNLDNLKKGKLRRKIEAQKQHITRLKKKFGEKLLVWIVVLVLAGALLGGIILVGAFAWYSRGLPDPTKINEIKIAQSTKIYDRQGETVLWEIHGNEKRTMVSLDQISKYIIWATISIEDKNFYQHSGFKITSIIRSVIMDIILRRKAQGGSTITQQLVKNIILSSEKKISRKIKELILSYKLEKTLTKDQILNLYFNEIPYGSVNYGVETASNYYFGKSAKDVTLAEAAILAALPKAPSFYSNPSNLDKLMERQHIILNEMVRDGYIIKEEAEAAKNETITFKEQAYSNIKAPHFVFYIRELLESKYGTSVVEQGGLKVTTTLDWEKQQIAEEAVKGAREKNLQYNATNAALVSVDAKNGQIMAMVGSMDFNDETIDGQVNVAVMKRQPGSSIKPVVYAAAFEKGFTSETVLYDVNTTFPNNPTPYAPKDYDKKERGPLTMRKSLAGSLNIPAVKTLYLAGISYVKTIMQNLGYSTITDSTQCGLSLVLGGCEVRLIDHVGAFTAFARDGERAEVSGILKVEDKDGKLLEEFQEKKHRVFSENTARQINSIMTDDAARSYIFGAGSPLVLRDRPAAAKTGTTNDNNDAWTIGFTPSFVTGVWVGNNDGADMKGNADGVNVAAPIWNQYMSKILANTPVEYFQAPSAIPDTYPAVLRGQGTGEVEVAIDKASGKLATPLTPPSYVEIKKFRQDHCLLYYIDKNNPSGPPPADPNADPMFKPWEDAVQDWVKRQAEKQEITYVNEQPPTEFDDLHVPQNTPTLTLLAPSNSQTIEAYPVRFEVNTAAPRGISRVVYEIGGQVVGVSRNSPFNLEVNSLDVPNGYSKLKVTAYDDIDNSLSLEIELNLKLPNTPTLINWLSPRQDASFYGSNFPLNMEFILNKTQNLQKVTFYFAPTGTGNTNQFAEILDFSNNQMSINWPKSPGKGKYEIYAVFLDKDGLNSQSGKLTITILE